VLCNSVIGGPMLYKIPPYRSSKIFVTWVFLRLRNHTFDGHISGLQQDRDNLKPLLRTKSPMPYRLVPLLCRSRDHNTSGSAFLAFRSLKNRRKRRAIAPPSPEHDPQIFLVVGSEGAYLSSEHGVPPVTGRGGGIFQRNTSCCRFIY